MSRPDDQAPAFVSFLNRADTIMPRVFISHSAKDRDFVEREIIAPLKRYSIDTFHAEVNIGAGEIWERQLYEELNKCDWLLVFITHNAAASDYVKDEVHWWVDNRREHIIPVLGDDTKKDSLHIRLLRLQHIDFRQNLQEGRQKLLALLGVDAASDELYEQARAASAAEDWPTAIQTLQAYLQVRPSHADAEKLLSESQQQQDLSNLYAAGLAHFQARRWRDALAELERVKELDDDYKDAARLVTEAQEQLIAVRIGALLQEADSAMANEVWDVAIRKLEEIFTVKPEHAEAKQKYNEARRQERLAGLYEAGLKLRSAGHWKLALHNFYDVRDRAPDYKDVAALIAEAQQQIESEHDEQKNVPAEEAPTEQKSQEQSAPSASDATDGASDGAIVQPRPSLVATLFGRFTKKMWLGLVAAVVLLVTIGLIGYLVILAPLGNVNGNNGNRNSGIAKGAEGDAGPVATAASMLNQMGEDLFNQGKYAAAEKKLREAVEMQPSIPKYHHNLAVVLFWQQNYREAEEQDREAIRLASLTPSYQDSLAVYQDSLAVNLNRLGKYDEAVEWSQKATQLNQYNAKYFVNLGNNLRMVGKWAEAVEAYNSALRVNPGDTDARIGLQNGPLNKP